MRVVLDTNVLVSVVITEGKAAKLLQGVLEKKVELVLSRAILDDFVDAMSRPWKNALTCLVFAERNSSPKNLMTSVLAIKRNYLT